MRNQLSVNPVNRQSIAQARAAGLGAGLRSIDRAEAENPSFTQEALDFIVTYIRDHGETPGESVTLAAVKAGIAPPDQRAFGPIYAMALRRELIHVVRFIPRVRGHGSAGGKLYAPGADPKTATT
jgi:hypothetical protein